MSSRFESFSMQGKVGLGIRNSDGSRQAARWASDSSSLEWDFTVNKDSQNESYTGGRGLQAELETSKTMQVKLTLTQLNDDNAALGMGGEVVSIAGGTVTAEPLPTGVVGDMIALEFAKVSDLSITGGAGGDTDLVEGTDYTLNAATGVLTYLTDQTTAPSAAYTYGSFSLITALTKTKQDFYVLFDGENTVSGATGLCRGEVHRISFDPASALALVNASFGTLELTGNARVDPVRLGDPNYGGYARLFLIDPDDEG